MATLSRISPEIPVNNIDDAITFYTRKLGFELAMEMPGNYAIVERDGIAIHLCRQPSASVPAGVHIFTHQLEDLQTELHQRGATISEPITLRPWGNRDFRITDCAGNTLKFTEPLGHS